MPDSLFYDCLRYFLPFRIRGVVSPGEKEEDEVSYLMDSPWLRLGLQKIENKGTEDESVGGFKISVTIAV